MLSNNEKFYQKNLEYIRKNNLEKVVTYISKGTPYLIAVIYLITLLFLLISKSSKLLITVLIPLTSFVIVTIIRKVYNRPRPVETMNIKPIFSKKIGESFPSRHAVSAFSIALALININIILGIIVLLLSFIVLISRIISGAHYISDVVASMIIALIIYSVYILII